MGSAASLRIGIRLSYEEEKAVNEVIRTGSASRIRQLTNSGRNEFCDFLIQSGEFAWAQAFEAAQILDETSPKELIRAYAGRASVRVRELDDLAVAGGDRSMAGVVAYQLLDLKKPQFRVGWGPIKKFLREWDSVLGFTLIERPERYQLLTERVRAYARPPRRRKLLTQTARATDEAASSRPSVEQTFAEISSTCMGLITRIALSYEPHLALRRELIQDILLAIWLAVPNFRGNASLESFVASIAQKRCISHVIRAAREPIRAKLPEDILTAIPPDEDLLLRNDQKRRLLEAIQQLPMVQREVIVLVLEGFSTRETAEILGISPKIAADRGTRAKHALRLVMRDQ